MALEDMEKTSFITPWGTYYYKVMPFGLKNAGAIYQCPATTLLHDLIHKELKVYVDDMIVKSKNREWHILALRKFFERIWFYKLRLNPKKCTFGVKSGKLLRFMQTFPATNNATAYEACIMSLQAAISLGVKELEVYGDSALIISQIQNKWKIKEERLMPHHECLQKWASKFSKIRHQYVPRMQNQIADALATMASMMDGPKEDEPKLIVLEHKEELAYCLTIEEKEEKNEEGEWYADILQYLMDETYSQSAKKNDQLTIRMLSTNYIICGERLYRRSYDGIHYLCVTAKEAHQIIKEVHESSYGPYMNAHMLSRKIMRQGYYWTTMEAECVAHVRKCYQCQVHEDLKHMPPMPLHTMTSPWPFSTWGIDIIGKIHPTASNGHEFILVAIDYFTKWVEAASYKVHSDQHHLQIWGTT
ncbi:uncharacterized protein LOC142620255 [Castanea sativa]|uniref:uncharacterized protein LOC142620255 n=1 Tax=Castanea sativa TaxID=21020 RepID=UPI003F6548CC